MQAPPARLHARQLTVRFGSKGILDRLNLVLQPGEIAFIEGQSGVGKSTLLRALAGLEELASGELWLDGQPSQTLSPSRYRAAVGYVAQRAVMFAGSVADNLQAGLSLQGARLEEQELQRLLKQLSLPATFGERRAKDLSGGEQQRVALARALALKPKVLLCDEPTTALDTETESSVLYALRDYAAEGASVVVVSHEPEHAALLAAASIYRLERGKLHSP